MNADRTKNGGNTATHALDTAAPPPLPTQPTSTLAHFTTLSSAGGTVPSDNGAASENLHSHVARQGESSDTAKDVNRNPPRLRLGERRTLHPATCTKCGNATEVPFVPDYVRPVYCVPCLKTVTRGVPR